MSKKLPKYELFDKRVYSRSHALKSLSTAGLFFYRIGAISLYLHDGMWKKQYHWWHPVIWISTLFVGVYGFFEAIGQCIGDMCKKVPTGSARLKHAPSTIDSNPDFIAAHLSRHELKRQKAGVSYLAGKIWIMRGIVQDGQTLELSPGMKIAYAYEAISNPVFRSGIVIIERIIVVPLIVDASPFPYLDWKPSIITEGGTQIPILDLRYLHVIPKH